MRWTKQKTSEMSHLASMIVQLSAVASMIVQRASCLWLAPSRINRCARTPLHLETRGTRARIPRGYEMNCSHIMDFKQSLVFVGERVGELRALVQIVFSRQRSVLATIVDWTEALIRHKKQFEPGHIQNQLGEPSNGSAHLKWHVLQKLVTQCIQ